MPTPDTYRTDQVMELRGQFSEKCGRCNRKRGDHSYRRLHCPDLSRSRGGFASTTFVSGHTVPIHKKGSS